MNFKPFASVLQAKTFQCWSILKDSRSCFVIQYLWWWTPNRCTDICSFSFSSSWPNSFELAKTFIRFLMVNNISSKFQPTFITFEFHRQWTKHGCTILSYLGAFGRVRQQQLKSHTGTPQWKVFAIFVQIFCNFKNIFWTLYAIVVQIFGREFAIKINSTAGKQDPVKTYLLRLESLHFEYHIHTYTHTHL